MQIRNRDSDIMTMFELMEQQQMGGSRKLLQGSDEVLIFFQVVSSIPAPSPPPSPPLPPGAVESPSPPPRPNSPPPMPPVSVLDTLLSE